MIRIASIGYGDIARRRHFPEFRNLGDKAQLVALAGRDEPSLAECARKFGVPAWYPDVDEMLARDDVDAVLVLTPPDSHGLFAKKAIEAGKHVLLEKPMVKSVEEATDLLQALKIQQQKKPITFFPLPHVDIPEHRVVARLIADGVIGEATSVECHRGHRGPSHADWFYRKELAGGGVLFDLGIYQVSAVVSLFGPARTVSALCNRHFDTRTMDDGTVVQPDVEDSALVSLWLDNRMAVTINANWNGSAAASPSSAVTGACISVWKMVGFTSTVRIAIMALFRASQMSSNSMGIQAAGLPQSPDLRPPASSVIS